MNTTIEIEEPKTIEKLKTVFHPLVKITTKPDSKVMRIEMEEDYTRIDFVTLAGHWLWVQMDSNCFIRPVGSDTRLTLVKAQGIPLAPNKYHFKSRNESLYYTLYFPALPKGTEAIDIIEKEVPGTYFNFYGVALSKAKSETLTVGN